MTTPPPDRPPPGILFTAFEPSGDEHAAPVIAELRRLRPDLPIHALGGPRMESAGATLIERTTDNPAMLAGVIGKITEHRRLLKLLRAFLAHHPIAAHVPTDSPAANWAICKMVKERSQYLFASRGGMRRIRFRRRPGWPKVVHLVAPQVWAWASWRVSRLKKWSDLVLCLLPFEPDWFARYGVNARFVGHPLFDEPTHIDPALAAELADFHGWPRLALLPGSRPAEIKSNWPRMLETAHRLKQHFPRLAAVAAPADARAADLLRSLADPPPFLRILPASLHTTLDWADVVLTVSGTVTLHVARAARPMTILFAAGPLSWNLLGRHLISTRTFTLPNLIHAAGPHRDPTRHVVREFAPLTSRDVRPIADEIKRLAEDSDHRARQLAALREIVGHFTGHHTGREAAAAILDLIAPADT